MTLMYVTLVAFIVVLYFVRRDRQYLKKDITEVLSPEMKKILNIKTTEDQFEQDLAKKAKSHKTSERILRGMNEGE